MNAVGLDLHPRLGHLPELGGRQVIPGADRGRHHEERADEPVPAKQREHHGVVVLVPIIEREDDAARRQRRTAVDGRSQGVERHRSVPRVPQQPELRLERRRHDGEVHRDRIARGQAQVDPMVHQHRDAPGREGRSKRGVDQRERRPGDPGGRNGAGRRRERGRAGDRRSTADALSGPQASSPAGSPHRARPGPRPPGDRRGRWPRR